MTLDARPSTSRGVKLRGNPQRPKTADGTGIALDIFEDLLSFYVRAANLLVSRDLDAHMAPSALAGGTGKISALLLIGANPGIRPSVLAHYILKDRSAMGKLLDQLGRAGLIAQRVSATERRARELYLTPQGQALAKEVRKTALQQSDAFFALLSEAERANLLRILKKLYAAHVGLVAGAAHDGT